MKKFHIAFISLAAVLFCAAVITFSTSNYHDSPKIQTQFEQSIIAPDQRLVDAQKANPDTVAWITIPGTNIDGPVQQSIDNNYYLRKDSIGNSDIEGCFFADFESNLIESSKLSTNTIIYGHSFTAPGQNKDIGFGQLRFYLDSKFAKKHPDIFLSVSDQMLHFSIESIRLADAEQDQICILAQPSNSQLSKLEQRTNDHNILNTFFSVSAGEKILTLSTCTENNNQRLIIVAKLK